MGKITHGSLFSGIGGFDLAAEWARWENLFHCEINEFGRKVLNYYWPNAISYEDITKTDFTIWREKIDVLTGGFPCQPYSMAGKRLGKEDERHLWPEMLRVIREVQPCYVVGENVPGLVNWNGGMVFDEVQADLEAEGYEVIPFILPAASVNAPHRRERVWFVAYANERTTGPSRTSTGAIGKWSGNNDEPKERGKQTEQRFRYGDVYRNDSHPNSSGLQEERPEQQTTGVAGSGVQWATPNTDNTGDNTRKCRNIGNGSKNSTERKHTQYELGGQSLQGVAANSECIRGEGLFGVQPEKSIREEFINISKCRATSNSERTGFQKSEQGEQHEQLFHAERNNTQDYAANTSNTGLQRSKDNGSIGGIRTESNEQPSRFFRTDWENFPTVSPIHERNDGLSDRLSGITFSKWRNEAVKACGNAIVPQVVFQIFKAIIDYEQNKNLH